MRGMGNQHDLGQIDVFCKMAEQVEKIHVT